MDSLTDYPVFMKLYRRYADTAGFPDVRPLRPKGRRLLSAYAARAEGKGFNLVCRKLLVCGELMPPVGSGGIYFGNRGAYVDKFGMPPEADIAVGDGQSQALKQRPNVGKASSIGVAAI